jgi:hypothetical protein
MDYLRRNASFIFLLFVIILVGVLAGAYLPTFARRNASAQSPDVWIEGVRSTAELATVDYTTVAEIQNEKVPEDIRRYLGVKEEIVMLVYGDVKAGFDLSKLSDQDVWSSGTRVQMILPHPQILSVTIDNTRTHVVYYQRSLIVAHDIQLEGATRQMADQTIQDEAIEGGVLDRAASYGKLYYENYLRSLGFTDVRVIVR